jgi:carbonic anhydrase
MWGPGQAHRPARKIDWLTISDREQSVVDDVERIRSHPLVPDNIPIHGYLYDVTTGRLTEVPQATGKAS